jgi:hypothetical protein
MRSAGTPRAARSPVSLDGLPDLAGASLNSALSWECRKPFLSWDGQREEPAPHLARKATAGSPVDMHDVDAVFVFGVRAVNVDS